MGAFEPDTQGFERNNNCSGEQCIIAYKVYDHCRSQLCLTPAMLGPARAVSNCVICGETLQSGDIIVPPCNASTVSIENLEISKISVCGKEPNPFRTGFWDIEIRYVFTYVLKFRSGECGDICCVTAYSVYKTKVTLFGAVGNDIVSVSDLYDMDCSTGTGPYVSVEGKAVALAAELKYPCGCICDCDCEQDIAPTSVGVTIGLFAIVKLFRPVDLCVHSSGFCVPEECKEQTPDNPCDIFDSIEFPIDIFSPPGVCGCGCVSKNYCKPMPLPETHCNEKPEKHEKKGCGCGCGK